MAVSGLTPEDSVEEGLKRVAAALKEDAASADLVPLADQAIATLLQEDKRATAVNLLTELRDKLHQARQLGRLTDEANLVERLAGRMRMDESFGPKSPIGPNINQQQNPELAAMLKQIQEADKASRPYDFQNTVDATEMTVTIPVPAPTKMADVKVKLTAKSIRVEVAGHSMQPCVLDGKFFGPVEEAAFDYHLEGSGEKRVLVLDLEKQKEGAKWPDLLNYGA
mmetsp:Transcript_36573/g.77807  ORF Transcript_36573/g.77807 Transcript_36573/m.77807 type:complete len:224 (+) Transcript_36573:71-742(+)|eukprot:CAMPEP_0206576026 /NCGR_PEP_ID=MMETSP0325_2-20121206/30485_1 /ASSEMBLY_ACC=CAM_ASM_000347 /TAXON_ID=2866 /ORGANISM="Crypthecodinium cohnii, Strain Seligo" /LENGTH=223 /DNA_ID=CAMNT_0054081121 /DNA_START=75 /DNA_END=743 /DNA_ORIENTATION=-